MQTILGKSREPQAKALVEFFDRAIAENRVGVPILHSEIESVIGQKRGDGIYSSIVSKVRRRLLRERGYHLLTLHGEGYQLANGSEQITAGKRRAASGLKRIVHAAVVVGAITDDRLTEAERRQRDHAASRLAALVSANRAEVKSLLLTVKAD